MKVKVYTCLGRRPIPKCAEISNSVSFEFRFCACVLSWVEILCPFVWGSPGCSSWAGSWWRGREIGSSARNKWKNFPRASRPARPSLTPKLGSWGLLGRFHRCPENWSWWKHPLRGGKFCNLASQISRIALWAGKFSKIFARCARRQIFIQILENPQLPQVSTVTLR